MKKGHVVVQLSEIPAEGLSLDLDFPSPWIQAAFADTQAQAEGASVHAQLMLLKTLEHVTVRGNLSGDTSLPCSRCAKLSPLAIAEEVRVTLVPKETFEADDDEGDVELSEEDLELSTYSGNVLHLDSLLREQLILSLPMRHLCVPDCKGLCSQCGVDLNHESCRCTHATVDPRWAALTNVKTKP